MRAALLNVVTAYSNPIRWASREKLYREFEQHMLDSGVKLTTVECAYGDRPHVLGNNPHVNHVKVRSKTLVWNKENLLNIGIARTEGEYIATFDADIMFRKPDWAAETVHALQQYDVIQPWSDCYDLGPDDDHMQSHRSFCRLWADHKPIMQGPNAKGGYQFGHPGYAWAYTRKALEWVGGLVETAVLGAADHHMALAFIGRVGESIPGNLTQAYKDPLYRWQNRAVSSIAGNISYLPGTIEHRWHGSKDKRKYVDRWQILAKHNFDPVADLKRNTTGVIELACNKPELRRDIDQYFRSRDEDSNTLSG
jgi:glycosyltransferase involved in cell wall biosynthesis